MKTKFTIFYLITISFFALFGVKALFHPGYYTSHDGWHQVARLFHFDKAITDGHFPPQWAGGLLHGAGYPLFVFNYHLPWYLAELFLFSGFTIFDSIKATFIAGYLLSGIFMFLWVKSIWGNRAGFLAAFLYLWAPYRFSNIFVRGSLGEATSFIFLPLIFWAISEFSKKLNLRFVILGSLGVAGLVLSHAMMAYFLFIPGTMIFLAYLCLSDRKKMMIIQSLLMAIIAFLISAYYVLPAVYYKPFTQFNQIISVYYKLYYQDYFVPFQRLIYSPWGYGFSGNAPDAMSMQVGIAQWLVVILAFLILGLILAKKSSKRNLSELILPVAVLVGFIFSIFMMLASSRPVWQWAEKLLVMDFPWRFLALTVFLTSFLAGWLVSMVSNLRAQIIVIILLVIIALYTNRNHLRVNQYTDIPLSLYIQSEQTTNTHDEYLPKWADRDFLKKERDKFILTSFGKGEEIHRTVDTTVRHDFSYKFDGNKEVLINLLYFPGWQGYIDGKKMTIGQGNHGLIKASLPAGSHLVSLRFEATPITVAGRILSFLGLFISLLIYFNFLPQKWILLWTKRVDNVTLPNAQKKAAISDKKNQVMKRIELD